MPEPTRLVQIRRGNERRVAIVEEAGPAKTKLRVLRDCASVYELALQAIAAGERLSAVARRSTGEERLDYDAIYAGISSDWSLLTPVDHPRELARCLVSGTGLTHLGSARDRQAMHGLAAGAPAEAEANLTDSMKMFRSGVERGRPAEGEIGVAPEWFYKGDGAILRAHGRPLEIPAFAEDGGEEAEIAALYVVDPAGAPRRIGFAVGNEFSDHRFERGNYLNLAGSKLRTCAIGPELILGAEFQSVAGEVRIEREGRALWSRKIRTGEAEMCHSLRNIEHHHFKFPAHRRPGDVHVHFLGADCLSFGEGIELADGDVMEVSFEGFGRPLRNPVRVERAATVSIAAVPLD